MYSYEKFNINGTVVVNKLFAIVVDEWRVDLLLKRLRGGAKKEDQRDSKIRAMTALRS